MVKFLCAVCLVAVFVASQSVSSASSVVGGSWLTFGASRGLETDQMAKIVGGSTTIEHYCCRVYPDCNAQNTACGDTEPNEQMPAMYTCYQDKRTIVNDLNKKTCQPPNGGIFDGSCTISESAHICKTVDQCTWKYSRSECGVFGSNGHTEVSVGDSCSPNCP